MRIGFLIVALVIAAAAQAEVYKWVDEKGVVHYGDDPPNRNAKPAELPKLQTYKQGTLPSLDDLDEPAPAVPAAGAPPAIRIVSPTPDQTFREPLAPVPVTVEITPALAEGQMLVYHVDGAVRGGPTPSTSFIVSGLERGAHSVAVAIVDGAGKEVLRSPAVTIHMKPPIAR